MAETAVAEKAVGINVPHVQVYAVGPDGKKLIQLTWEAVHVRRKVWDYRGTDKYRWTWHWEYYRWKRGEILSSAGPVSRNIPIRILYDEDVEGAKDLAGQYAGELKYDGFGSVEVAAKQ